MKILSLSTHRKPAFACLIALMILVGLLRITLTYRVFWQTWDEPARIAGGMQWLAEGQYTYERFTPPFACVMSALGPYLAGVRSTGQRSMWDEGNAILHRDDAYERNLTLARLGILPFFIVAALVVAAWAKVCGGSMTALLAVLLLTTLPATLGLSGVAGLDMACAACVIAALFAFDTWLKRPTIGQSCLLGATAGLAILTKFTAVGFLLAAGGLMIVVYSFQFFRKDSLGNHERLRARRWITASALAVLLCFLVIWGGYRFSTGPLFAPGPAWLACRNSRRIRKHKTKPLYTWRISNPNEHPASSGEKIHIAATPVRGE